MNDVTSPKKVVEVTIARRGGERTLWVNVDEKCELRINCISNDVEIITDILKSADTSAYNFIEPRIIFALRQYADHHRPVGGFLTAFLSNDLQEAVGKADQNNIVTLQQIAGYVHNEMPRGCHGSREAVKAWLA